MSGRRARRIDEAGDAHPHATEALGIVAVDDLADVERRVPRIVGVELAGHRQFPGRDVLCASTTDFGGGSPQAARLVELRVDCNKAGLASWRLVLDMCLHRLRKERQLRGYRSPSTRTIMDSMTPYVYA